MVDSSPRIELYILAFLLWDKCVDFHCWERRTALQIRGNDYPQLPPSLLSHPLCVSIHLSYSARDVHTAEYCSSCSQLPNAAYHNDVVPSAKPWIAPFNTIACMGRYRRVCCRRGPCVMSLCCRELEYNRARRLRVYNSALPYQIKHPACYR